MSHLIDEPTAWRLVLATSPASETRGTASKLPRADAAEGAAHLRVDPWGRWEAAVPVTPEARDLFDLYLPLRARAEWALGQAGQSLDGRIATEAGHSHYVTGPEDRRRLHRVRALADAVVVGAGTVAADDPALTVREVEGESPVRVVLDPEGRLDSRHGVFRDGAAPTLVIRRAASGSAVPDLHGEAEVVPVPAPVPFDPHLVLRVLRQRGLSRVLVEGGGITVSAFLRAGALDRLHVTVAPLLIGPGPPSFLLDPVEKLDRALRPSCRHFVLGDDILFDLDLRADQPPAATT